MERLEQASQSLAFTTDYLAAMAETSEDEDDEEQDECDEKLHGADEERSVLSTVIERTARIEDGDQPAPTEAGAATDD